MLTYKVTECRKPFIYSQDVHFWTVNNARQNIMFVHHFHTLIITVSAMWVVLDRILTGYEQMILRITTEGKSKESARSELFIDTD